MAVRAWQVELLQRLQAAGYDVGVRHQRAAMGPGHRLDAVLALEAKRFGAGLAALVPPPPVVPMNEPDLLVDLTGQWHEDQPPVLRLYFSGQSHFADGLTQMLATGERPVVSTEMAGQAVGVARPMLSDLLWLTRASNDMLAGAISLVEQSVARFFAGALTPVEAPAAGPVIAGFLRHYLPHVAGSLAARLVQRLTRRRPFYWQTAFRVRGGGDGIAATVALDGAAFTTLEDDSERFYADPFVIERDGQTFLFVEEYPYATGKGIISVATLGADGRFSVPRVVLEEPYHLSYPQVFSHGGAMFMLPESGGARRLVLYHAASFPDQWEIDTVLEDLDINDATLLQRDGKFWLFGTERRGSGSASDTLVVFSAPDLRGPWVPHKLNPIAIDCAAARPGGAFIERDGRIFLPLQDGRESYGGGLGLAELLRLDDDAVVLTAPIPIRPGAAWARKGIHTLNGTSRVEVVDSAG